MAAAYLVAETTAGWLTWLFAGTVVLLPTWATAWAGIERRLVVLAGLQPIASRVAGRAGVAEVALLLVTEVGQRPQVAPVDQGEGAGPVEGDGVGEL